ncbi:MAG: alpha/beta hydrolase [Candidatus Omnitrophica bacterium]|nr:alpha/beta hydrolase [Candidatus Omnitrophota bacterium]
MGIQMKIFLWAIIAAIIFLVSIRYIERHSIYFPMKDVIGNPASVGLAYEEVYFDTSDNKRLNGWYIPNSKAKFTIIFCHGNAGNISHRLEKILIFYNLGLNIFVFDYRGYGKSEGAPSESGLYEDADAAYNYLTTERRISKDDIILYGESIGGAVAIDLAQRISVLALITEATFTSAKDMSEIAFPFIPYFVFSSRFDSVFKIKDIACPKLIIHSVNDEIVPFRLGEKLFDAAMPPKKFRKIRGGHNTAFLESREEYANSIKTFINSLAK